MDFFLDLPLLSNKSQGARKMEWHEQNTPQIGQMDADLRMMELIPTNEILAILPIHSQRYISLQTTCVCKWCVNKKGIVTSLQSCIVCNKATLSFPQ